MTTSTETPLKLEAVQTRRPGTCVMTGDTIDPGEKCWWVEDHGVFRQDLTEEDIRDFLKESVAVDYKELAEGLACELEAAIAELTRRGADINFDTEIFRQYRTLHPRQDS